MEKRAVSASTSMRWVLRSIVGSAQISSRVLSGPMPARLSAAATLTLAGKPRAPSRALPSKIFFGALRSFERNAALDQIGRAFEPVRRLARDHRDRTDGAFGGGAHRIEAEERAGRHQDARAGRLRPLHQIPIFQKLADRERHENLSRLDHRNRHLAKHLRRQAFDDDVARLRQRLGGDDRNAGAGLRQIAPRLVRDRAPRLPRERGPGMPVSSRRATPRPTAPRPANPTLSVSLGTIASFHWQRCVRPDTLSMRLPACGQYGRPSRLDRSSCQTSARDCL